MRVAIIYSLLFVLFFSSCRSPEKEVSIEFQLIQNGARYPMSTAFFKGDTAVAFDLFHFYISELTIGDQLVSDILFVDPNDSSFSNYTLNLDKPGESVQFGLGVAADMNAMDPTSFATTHPLSSAFAMYWTWASKYRYIKAEGRFNASGDLSDATSNGGIIWHTGTDPLYLTRTVDLDIRPGDHLVFKLDLDTLLSQINLRDDAFTHTTVDTYQTAERVSENTISAFEIVVE